MLRLRSQHRRVLIETVPKLANFAIAPLIFGQFLSERPLSVATAIGAVAVWAALIGVTLFFAAGEGQ